MSKSNLERAVDFFNNLDNITIKFTSGKEFIKLDSNVTSEIKGVDNDDIKNIVYLDASNNNLLGLPDCVAEAVNLEVVILDNNHFTKPTRVLKDLKKLKMLSMRNNNLSYLPQGLTINT